MNNAEKVYAHISTLCQQDQLEDIFCLSASEVATGLGMKRNFASHILNRLVEEGALVKSQTRPVVFVDKKAFDNPPQWIKEIAFETHLKQDAPEPIALADPFSELIGHDGSLKYIVEQCRAAVLYPPIGLPIMLCGASGVGKSILAQKIHAYSIFEDVIAQNAPFIVFNCAEYAHNPELLSATLFGHVKGAFTGADAEKMGLLEAAQGGILFLDEIHRLSPEGQEKLFLFLDQGIYRRLGETSGWRKASVRLVFATTEEPEGHFLQTFLRRIPLVVKVPSYEQRPLVEKRMMIKYFYLSEAHKLSRVIQVSGQVVKLLVKTHTKGNIGNLTNAIKLSCASALSDNRTSSEIIVRLSHLPKIYQEGLDQHLFDGEHYDDWVIDNRSSMLYQWVDTRCEVFSVFRQCVSEWLSTFNTKKSFTEVSKALNELLDTVVYGEVAHVNPMLLGTIEKIVSYQMAIYRDQYGLSHFGNSVHVISKLVQFVQQMGSGLASSEDQLLWDKLHKRFSKSGQLTEQLVQVLNLHLGERMPSVLYIVLAIYLQSLEKSDAEQRCSAVIIAHGYATASSMASVANRVLGHYIYDAFDMPLDVTSEAILKELMQYIRRINHERGLIILVDMGSLEGLHLGLEDLCHGDIGVINNMTTHMAIDVGERIISGEAIGAIVESAAMNCKHRFQFVKSVMPKPRAILTTCSTGIGTAQKIKSLLSQCFENDSVEILAYDFGRIRGNGLEDEVFTKYEVLLIIGTSDPLVGDMPYVSIEDLIMERCNERVIKALSHVVAPEKIEHMNREMAKHFTFDNVLGMLTILNPRVVVEQVDEALHRLERRVGQTLLNSHRIGLTLHTCCMIERLVMKTPIEAPETEMQFVKAHEAFVSIVKEAFQSIEKHYNVTLPVSEIQFIYDHMRHRMNGFNF